MTQSISRFFHDAPAWLSGRLLGATKWRRVDWSATSSDAGASARDGREQTNLIANTEAFGSRLPSGRHLIMLDLDIPAALLPSTTEGHHHFVANVSASWEDYAEFLNAAAKVGLVERAYAELSIKRGYASIRAPWVRKGREKEDVASAIATYLMDEALSARIQHILTPF